MTARLGYSRAWHGLARTARALIVGHVGFHAAGEAHCGCGGDATGAELQPVGIVHHIVLDRDAL
jgi:hypothetical protein